ncbi:hypothetical protein JCM3774_004343 [Rhodotorula dairenensis]
MAKRPLACATTRQLVRQLGLPSSLADRVRFSGSDPLPSTLHLGELAQALIATTALAASHLRDLRIGDSDRPPSEIRIRCEDAVAEFRSEHVATLDGEKPFEWDRLAGAYRARGESAWIRPHTNWEHHKRGFLDLLGLPASANRQDVASAVRSRDADELAERAMQNGLVCTALRSYAEWDAHSQGQAALARASRGPVRIDCVARDQSTPLPPLCDTRRPLEGVRVLDLTRVIAGPVAGRVLAGYGADVLWITSSDLPALPGLDFDTARGKRSAYLDLRPSSSSDRHRLESLIRTADVLLQSYAPGALTRLGFGPDRVRELNPQIVYASLTAWGAVDVGGVTDGEADSGGPWRNRKGFDSLVQFASGIAHAEGMGVIAAKAHQVGEGSRMPSDADEFSPRQLPCQALDHGAGYLVASGIITALARRHTQGGSYLVTTSLLDTAVLLRSLGSKLYRAPAGSRIETAHELRARGRLGKCVGERGKQVEYVQHAAMFERGGIIVGWDKAPTGLGADAAEWLPLPSEKHSGCADSSG